MRNQYISRAHDGSGKSKVPDLLSLVAVLPLTDAGLLLQGRSGTRTFTPHRPLNFCRVPRERGQSLILFTLFLAAMLGLVGLVSDVGFALHNRTSLQAGVDAAALAGASELPDIAKATALAADYAAQNGLTEADVELTFVTPYNGDPTKIEVTANRTQDTYFAKVLGIDFFDVSARSVATMQANDGVTAALLALNPTKCGALNKSGGSTISINNSGGIMVNSSCKPSIDTTGGGTVTAAAINYYYKGGYNQSGSQLTPTPTAVGQPTLDPLKDVPPPDLSTMTQSPDSGGTASNPSTKTLSSGTITLNPGIYYGGLNIKSSANVTLNPGIYVMAGGGFTVQGGPTISGSEIMVYNTFNAVKPTGAGACGAIDLSGQGVWSYSPPTSGIYKGVAMWQDKACTVGVKLTGSNGGPSGVIYAPTAIVKMSGSGSLGSIQLIADSFEVTGSGNMSVDFTKYIDIPLDLSPKLVE